MVNCQTCHEPKKKKEMFHRNGHIGSVCLACVVAKRNATRANNAPPAKADPLDLTGQIKEFVQRYADLGREVTGVVIQGGELVIQFVESKVGEQRIAI